MNDGIELCGVCERPVDIEHDTGFVTTALGVVVHTQHLPLSTGAVGDELGRVGGGRNTQSRSTERNQT